jgi:N,N'-diacetyllegionaminate synthase
MNLIKIGDKKIGEGKPCYIIAEAGVNHNGRLDYAKELIQIASDSGADAVKFQTFKVENLILKGVNKTVYQKKNTKSNLTQTEMLYQLQISRDFHLELISQCKSKNIQFLSTPYDNESLDLLISLNVPALKVASTDTTNLLFLEKIASTKLPVILSTGMSDLSEISTAYTCLRRNGCKNLAILKCTSEYPTKPNEVNLKSMITLATIFDAIIGFSDHTSGIGASPYAVSLGAKIVEKHFTIDKKLPGPDHKASLSPKELHILVREIRRVEMILGTKEIYPTDSERKNKILLQKNLVAQIFIRKGQIINRENITAKRTGGIGIAAIDSLKTLGMKSRMDINPNTPLNWWMLEQ